MIELRDALGGDRSQKLLWALFAPRLLYAFLTVAFLLQPLSAQEIDATMDVYSVVGNKIDLTDLVSLLDKASFDEDISDLSLIISSKGSFDDLKSAAIKYCGRTAEFSKLFDQHMFEQRLLKPDELHLLTYCVSNVFSYLDKALALPTHGFYKRFDRRYIKETALRAYQCGYRTQELLTYYSVAVWLVGNQEVAEDERFRCLGDIDSDASYSLDTIKFGVDSILDDMLYLIRILPEWADVRKYLALKRMILNNRHLDACNAIFDDYVPNSKDFLSLLIESNCKLEETEN